MAEISPENLFNFVANIQCCGCASILISYHQSQCRTSTDQRLAMSFNTGTEAVYIYSALFLDFGYDALGRLYRCIIVIYW